LNPRPISMLALTEAVEAIVRATAVATIHFSMIDDPLLVRMA